jgi:hypothetical protein
VGARLTIFARSSEAGKENAKRLIGKERDVTTKRSTESGKGVKKAKSLPVKALSSKKAKGVKGGIFQWGGVGGESTTGGHEKWIQ